MPVDYSAFSIVLMALVLAVCFVFGSMFVIRLWTSWRVRRPDKTMTYECGEDPVSSAWLRFNIRFYMVALAFLLFEVELVLSAPVFFIVRDSLHAPVKDFPAGAGAFVLAELLIFIGILFMGLLFAWAAGDLDWVRDVTRGDKPVKRDLMPKMENHR
jgi:NADH-quinone oxidoreductase subunit A